MNNFFFRLNEFSLCYIGYSDFLKMFVCNCRNFGLKSFYDYSFVVYEPHPRQRYNIFVFFSA